MALHRLHFSDYTVSHKERAAFVFRITLADMDDFENSLTAVFRDEP